MGAERTLEPCKIADALGGFIQKITPLQKRSTSLVEAWDQILPDPLREHCRIVSIKGGSLKVSADSASYMYELQLCKTELLSELQRLCPGARLYRMQFIMSGS